MRRFVSHGGSAADIRQVSVSVGELFLLVAMAAAAALVAFLSFELFG